MGSRRYLSAGIVVAISFCAMAPRLRADDAKNLDVNGLLFVSQDSASLERQIASYIQAHYGFNASFNKNAKNPEDIYLGYTIGAKDGNPELKVYIDTMVSGRDKETKQVSERAINVSAYFSGARTCASMPDCRRRLFEMHNKFMVKNWVPHRVYLDKDGDVAFRSSINISGGMPVHVEHVNDLLIRLITAWQNYNEAIREEFGSLP